MDCISLIQVFFAERGGAADAPGHSGAFRRRDADGGDRDGRGPRMGQSAAGVAGGLGEDFSQDGGLGLRTGAQLLEGIAANGRLGGGVGDCPGFAGIGACLVVS